MKKNYKNKTLIIIAGAAGEIGTEFCKKATENNIDCIGVIRNNAVGLSSPFLTQITCHLDDENSIIKAFASIDFSKYKKIVYLHTIGVDKFDPRGYPKIKPMDSIPSDVYNTNVNSFKYLLKYCVLRVKNLNEENNKKIKLKVAIIAGVADKHAPFVIESFCEAKYILRQYIQSCVGLYKGWFSGLSINVTSTITNSALKVRPHADTTFWLKPSDVSEQSFSQLILGNSKYKEIDIIKNSPKFFTGYYESNKILYEKWSKETGIK